MKKEIWKSVRGYKGCYEVSNLGRVRSLDRFVKYSDNRGRVFIKGKVLKPTARKSTCRIGRAKPYIDYRYTVHLFKKGKRRKFYISHLVARTFLGPRPKGMYVCHNNGNSLNDNLVNLRYATPKENCEDKHIHGTALTGEKVAISKLTEKDVRLIRKEHKKGVSNVSLARKYGVADTTILSIVKGRNWKTGNPNDYDTKDYRIENAKKYRFKGEKKTLKEWSFDLDIPLSTLYGRLERGHPIEKAFEKRDRRRKK